MPMVNSMTKKIFATALILSVALGGLTACSSQNDTKPAASSSASATKSTPADTTQKDKQKVASTYQSFLEQLYQVKDADVQAAIKKATEGESDLNDGAKKRVLASLEQSFPFLKKLDVEGYSLDDQARTYGAMLTLGAAASTSDIVVDIPASSVTVKGDYAQVDTSKISIKVDGKESDPTKAAAQIQLERKNGEWLINPKTIASDSSSSTGE